LSADFEIRKLTGRDAGEWWRLRLKALEREPHAFGSAAEDHRETTVEAAARRIAGSPPDDFILGTFHDARLTGAAGFYRERERKSCHKGHVWGVYVTHHRVGAAPGAR